MQHHGNHQQCSGCCVAGPKEKLDSTVISQPAIYVASLAAVEKLRQTEGEVDSLRGPNSSPSPSNVLLGAPFNWGHIHPLSYFRSCASCWMLQEAVQAADVTAGLSLGEYTALTFAGALKYALMPPEHPK
jgi:[acyl-carrier-protein] S-malonyltransferase